MSPLVRQWTLLLMLARRRGLTVSEMAQEQSVVDRTIRRDLDLMRSVGLPLIETVGIYGRKSWRLDLVALAAQLGISSTKHAEERQTLRAE